MFQWWKTATPTSPLVVVLFVSILIVSHCELYSLQDVENQNIHVTTATTTAESDRVSLPESTFSFDDSTLYRLNWIDANTDDIKMLDDSNNNLETDNTVEDGEVVILTSGNNEQYRCIIPVVNKSLQETVTTKEPDVNPYQLLKPIFTKKLCSFRMENYWTYEICHGRYIRQFHEDSRSREAVQEYFLGKFDINELSKYERHYEENERGKKRPVVNVEDLQLPYVEVNMTEGTLCDLSNKKRMTRVRYVCVEEGNHDLYSIKESSTCEYEVITFSPLLCKSSEFKLKMAIENEVKCYPMNDSPLIPKGFELNKIQNEAKQRKALQSQVKEKSTDGGLFEGKTILIETSNFGKSVRINIMQEKKPTNTYEVQQFLSGDHCLTGGTGWWKYEFCYGKKVNQFHEEKKGKKVVINLGNWDLNEHIKWMEENPSKKPKSGKTPKQVSHFYSFGESCDLTKKPRTVEVKLKCPSSDSHSESVTIYLMEPKTCEYVLVVESVIICDLLSTVDEYGLFHLTNDADVFGNVDD